MNYINKISKEYPVYETHILARDKGFDAYQMVYNSEIPSYDKVTQMCEEIEPTKIADDYFRQYRIIEKSLEQIDKEFKTTVPQIITKVQAMRAMKQTDVNATTNTSMWTNFQALLASNMNANDEWLLALELQRSHTLVLALTPTLGKTERQIDELFVLGATL